jgi:F5/8 type C domain-containing protein
MKNTLQIFNQQPLFSYAKFISLFLLVFSISVFAEAQTNVALHKHATQSSNYSSNAGLPGNAVDGNKSGIWADKSVSHTKGGSGQANAWWSVDLGEVYTISKIQIWNRTDCCQNRLDNFRILIKEGPKDPWSTFTIGYHKYQEGQTYPLVFNDTKFARYVMVQLTNPNGILSLAEVEVYGTPIQTLPNAETQFARAEKIGSPDGCESGSFKDPIYGGTCWTCPEGSKRTVFAVQGTSACEVPAGEIFAKAIQHSKGKGLLGTDCDGGQFWDPNGYCYSCPSGYNRTAYSVTSDKACSQRVHASYTAATKVGEYGCDEGFLDIGTNKCWTCPDGYRRTVYSVKSEKACEKIAQN